ncbi:MAG: hypothetical protein PHY34_03660 [Patescibacteria group bacterium]|nr:hypothetical protein [Patescibacteria group bacterium]MDD5716012.1 hypothetical protein [Patescibacteria group bacterium]
MADIHIIKKTENDSGWQYTVRISDGNNSTEHIVAVPLMTCRRITGNDTEADKLLRKSIEFLLERENQNSILSEFEIEDISTYFPEWERTMFRELS